MAEKIKSIFDDFEKAKGNRRVFESHWQDVADYVIPDREFVSFSSSGSKLRQHIYDDTGPDSAETLAGALHGMLTNPAVKWFALRTDDSDINNIPEVATWFYKVEDIMFSIMGNPKFGFATNMHECYLDLVSFGTSAMVFVTDQFAPLKFRCRPLTEIYAKSNADNEINTVYREFELTNQQASDVWGELAPPKVAEAIRLNKKLDDKRTYLHVVMPREHRAPMKQDGKNKAFASLNIDVEEKLIITEGGFDEFPYLIPRWAVKAGEVYGRSPSMKMLPTIMMLNAMGRTLIVAAEKAVDPPLIIPANSVEGPIRTAPASLIYRRSDSPIGIETLPPGRVDIGVPMIAAYQEAVKRGFFLDVIGALPLQDRMTTVEVHARLQQKMQIMSPILARLVNELLSPLITRLFRLMFKRNMFPEMPDELSNQVMAIDYVSPLALSQKASELQNVERWTAFTAPFVQADPQVLDNFDPDQIVRHGGNVLNVPPSAIRTEEEIQEIRNQRAQQQQAAIQAQTAQTTATAARQGAAAIKDIQGIS